MQLNNSSLQPFNKEFFQMGFNEFCLIFQHQAEYLSRQSYKCRIRGFPPGNILRDGHMNAILEALQLDKPIPIEVLKEYRFRLFFQIRKYCNRHKIKFD